VLHLHAEADPVIDLDQFVFSLDGGMRGEVSGFNPDCPIQIGPYMAEITDGTLIFDVDEAGDQQASLQAAATASDFRRTECIGFIYTGSSFR
jgi:hypothetical protein